MIWASGYVLINPGAIQADFWHNLSTENAIHLLGYILIGIVSTWALLFGWQTHLRNKLIINQIKEEKRTWNQRIEKAQQLINEQEHPTHAWNGVRKFEVARKVDEGGSIKSFYLKPHDHNPLPPYCPGQYLTFHIKTPNQDKPVVRCYSLSDSCKEDHYRVSIKAIPAPRDKDVPPGLISNHFHQAIHEGDILDVMAPAGHFYLNPAKEQPVVLIGGGIGITPVLSMLNSIAESNSNLETWFFYGVRNSQEHIMAEHLKQIDQQNENIYVRICYSDPLDDDQKDLNYHHQERVSVDLFKRLLPSNNYGFYICGPAPMMQSVTNDLYEWGVPERDVHFETFGPATIKRRGVEKDVQDKKVTVDFHLSAKQLRWDGSHENLLEFAEQHDIKTTSGCRSGNCGTCAVAIRSGTVEYNIPPGASVEDGSCLMCIAKPKSDLELDL